MINYKSVRSPLRVPEVHVYYPHTVVLEGENLLCYPTLDGCSQQGHKEMDFLESSSPNSFVLVGSLSERPCSILLYKEHNQSQEQM